MGFPDVGSERTPSLTFKRCTERSNSRAAAFPAVLQTFDQKFGSICRIPNSLFASEAQGVCVWICKEEAKNSREMAAVAEQESETRLCSNCKKDIPVANFTIHEIHCSRNLGVCPMCKESFPKSEMRSHQELEHTQVMCKCSMKMDRGLLQEHVALACPLRPVTCQHCDLELAFNKLRDHEDYCGTRTERCVRCSRNVMLKDLKEHPKDCGEKAEEARMGPAKPCLNSAVLRDQLHRRNPGPLQPDQNRDHLEKATNTLPFVGSEPDCDLDYLLALSLQRENNSHDHDTTEIRKEFGKNICPTRTRPAEHYIEANDSSFLPSDFLVPDNGPNNRKIETLLPCEFCEELYPEEHLILHQTGCNPASALASFSKRRSSVPRHDRDERLMDLWEQLQGSRPVGGSREAFPLQHDLGGSLMLPCEFCGVQLEEEILFHHQDKCDLRPATSCSTGRAPLQQEAPAVDNLERTESPDVPRRRIRHQGEISPQYLEEFRQQRPPQPIHRLPPGVAARLVQLTPPNNTQESKVGPSEQGKLRELGSGGGRSLSWGAGSLPAAPLPARPSPPGDYVPSFPTTAPRRPSLHSEGGQSTTRSAHHHNSTKGKPWRPESDYPDEE
ncbi:TRAF-type zinc finger domain-containing protein 1 isoform X2 [Hemicordylus capensis]|uniref:TRAF-type zinc finger domain-containing protein 1 isoform X2 n=1 Tax=Hemicordylus capensis TaxID=884348 RepID=UPI00230339B1|nr:TRAF-type zinc finger domain-containing protein 1 isoform X2 [Hemicordylus capensis]